MKVRRFNDPASLDVALAKQLKQILESEDAAVMLSGGHAPLPAYGLLGSQTLHPASGTHLLYSDERHVPLTSDASNYRASLPLLRALNLPEDRVLRVRTELPVAEAAADYERRLQRLLSSDVPIRLGLLGMGADGHTASLFTPVDLERSRGYLAIPVQRPDGMQAVSVTPGLLSRVERILMIVVGAQKREALAALIARDPELIAWRAIAGCRNIEVWCENQV